MEAGGHALSMRPMGRKPQRWRLFGYVLGAVLDPLGLLWEFLCSSVTSIGAAKCVCLKTSLLAIFTSLGFCFGSHRG